MPFSMSTCGQSFFFFHSVWKSFLAGVIPVIKLKKVGKTNRLFIYDLNQIPYDYKLEVTIGSRD